MASKSTTIPDEAPDAGRQLARALTGQVRGSIHTDTVTRLLYATDASNHRIVPDAVLVARDVADISAAIAACRQTGIPVTARGAGTSLAGQAVGRGLHLDTFHLDGVKIDADARIAQVLPGTIQRSLDQAAGIHGLTFGPQTATSNRATLGGMVGNNSAGTRSVIYGLTSDRLTTVDAVLADGTMARFGPTDATGSLASGMQAIGIDGQPRTEPNKTLEMLATELVRVRRVAAPLVAEHYPTLLRHVDGYALDELVKPQPNLARFLAGSEGTLALFTGFEVELDGRPAERALAVLSFDDVIQAIEAVPELLERGPSAVELLDRTALQHAREDVSWLVRDGAAAVLYVEFQGEVGEAVAAGERLASDTSDPERIALMTEPALQERAWRLRERGLAAMQSITRPGTLPAFVDDTAVAPERLGAYVREFQRIVASYDTHAVMFGHVSVGCLHIYPLIDVRTAEGVRNMESMASEIVDLVRAFDGALSGEHGDGLSKSQWLTRYFGPEVVSLFGDVKHAFDPTGLLNPGKIVHPEPMTTSLRYGESYRVRELAPSPLSFDSGYPAAVEQCFGAGACRKLDGAMCPPAMATRSESLSTRARANALRGVLTGDVPLSDLGSDEMREVMETCIACKACASDCPVGVDMAALKTDWQWRVHMQEGVPLQARVLGSLRTLLRAASIAPGPANRVLQSRALRALLRHRGFAEGRTIPEIATSRFSRTAKRFGRRASGDGAVLIFADCFTEFFEPWIGIALEKVLLAQDRPIGIPRAGCCGRTAYSQGLLEQAGATARRTARALALRVAAGQTLAVCEPSCLSMIRDDWKRLLPDDNDVATVVSAARSAEEAVLDRDTPWLRPAAGAVVLQSHCHEQALGGVDATSEMVGALPGIEVNPIGQGCCGMAGGFGYQADHRDLSHAIGERALAPAIRAATGQPVLATGFSCRTQIHDLTGRVALHPIDYLARHLR